MIRSPLRTALLFALALLGAWLILPNLQISWRAPTLSAQTGNSGLGVTPSVPPKSLPEGEVYARAAQIAYKSVVNIDTTQRVRVRSFFDDFFDAAPRYRENSSQGSGVIITRDGYILTNEHVVGGAHEAGKKITVTTTDGRRFDGVIVGADRTTDVALVKVSDGSLPTARMGTVRGLVPGQMAVAIGNPLGLRFTVTNGVISALGRPLETPDGRIYPDLIQHSALINPGNSGGALINLQGQLIGINTLVAGGAQGIGFAIPIDTALRIAEELKRYGKVKRPWLGIVGRTNNPYFVARYGLPDVQGAVVTALHRGSPAMTAGLEAGDIIVRLNDQPVRSEEDLQAIEKQLKIGQRVSVEVVRYEERYRGTIVVGEAP